MIWIPFSKYSASQLEWAVFVLFVLDKINFLLVSTVSNSNLSSSTVLLEELLDEELITLEFTDDEEVTLYLMNPKAPCFIRDENESYVYLILPVNFNAGV